MNAFSLQSTSFFCKFFYISYLHFLLNDGKVMAQIMWKAKIEKI